MKPVLKNVIKLAKGSLNNIFQDSFNIILSQQLTHDRSYVSSKLLQVVDDEVFMISPNCLCYWTCTLYQKTKFVYLNATKRQNSRLIQIESICRQQNKCNPNIKICFENGGKHCGKRRKCWLPAFSPFPTMFSRAFFSVSLKVRIVG